MYRTMDDELTLEEVAAMLKYVYDEDTDEGVCYIFEDALEALMLCANFKSDGNQDDLMWLYKGAHTASCRALGYLSERWHPMWIDLTEGIFFGKYDQQLKEWGYEHLLKEFTDR